ncbi:MAG: hypothetical protein M3220_06980 [Chloroflexota bacterium]|nr:hypothetical protein [Chloroflexota bacterium]
MRRYSFRSIALVVGLLAALLWVALATFTPRVSAQEAQQTPTVTEEAEEEEEEVGVEAEAVQEDIALLEAQDLPADMPAELRGAIALFADAERAVAHALLALRVEPDLAAQVDEVSEEESELGEETQAGQEAATAVQITLQPATNTVLGATHDLLGTLAEGLDDFEILAEQAAQQVDEEADITEEQLQEQEENQGEPVNIAAGQCGDLVAQVRAARRNIAVLLGRAGVFGGQLEDAAPGERANALDALRTRHERLQQSLQCLLQTRVTEAQVESGPTVTPTATEEAEEAEEDEEAAGGVEVELAEISADPDEYIDQLVTVNGFVDQFVAPNAFMLVEEDELTDDGILVLASGDLTGALESGDNVLVSGTVQQLTQAEFEEEFELDDEELTAQFENEPVILLSSVIIQR